jgi:hypothetical protein
MITIDHEDLPFTPWPYNTNQIDRTDNQNFFVESRPMTEKDTAPSFPQWHHRVPVNKDGRIDEATFVKLADQFISLANSRNKKVLATELQFVMLFAAARYTAHVAKNVLDIDDQEVFAAHMMAQFKDMLREHLADPTV